MSKFQEIAVLKAKLDLAETKKLVYVTQEQKLKAGFVGGGYFVTLSITEEEHKAVKFFIKAKSRAHALSRLQEFPEAYYFVQENPTTVLSIIGAGLQHPATAEGLIYEQQEAKKKTQPVEVLSSTS